MSNMNDIELFAWLGEDEFGSGEIGLKQGMTPAGIIPLVAIKQESVERYKQQLEMQAASYGKRIKLCRFVLAEVICETEQGT
jgi:hypothetical protein